MKQFITRLSVVALAIAAMVACGDKKGVDYTNIIPEHPMVLVEVDGYKTLDEAGLIDLVAPYREQAAALLGSQAGELVKNIILDVNNTGIETEAPMFLFVTGEENVEEMTVVAVAKVGDKAKVDELVAFVEENIGEIRKKEKTGAVVISIEDEEEFMLGTTTTPWYSLPSLTVLSTHQTSSLCSTRQQPHVLQSSLLWWVTLA